MSQLWSRSYIRIPSDSSNSLNIHFFKLVRKFILDTLHTYYEHQHDLDVIGENLGISSQGNSILFFFQVKFHSINICLAIIIQLIDYMNESIKFQIQRRKMDYFNGIPNTFFPFYLCIGLLIISIVVFIGDVIISKWKARRDRKYQFLNIPNNYGIWFFGNFLRI